MQKSSALQCVTEEGKLTVFTLYDNLVPKALFPGFGGVTAPHLQSQGKAPWGRGWLACVASVFVRVRRESWDESSRSNFRAITRLGTIATQATSKVIFRSTEGQTFYGQFMTADDSIKCRCAHSGMTGQVDGFLLFASFFSRSLTVVPLSLLRNWRETFDTNLT